MGDFKRRIVLARHGETEWSKTMRHTGRTDIPLTDEGRQEASALKPKLAKFKFAKVWSSPLTRSLETAKLAGFDSPEVDSNLLEWDYGDYEGITSAEVRGQHPGWVLWKDGVTGGESIEQVGTRADAIIENILSTSGDVLVFAHGHILRVLAARWLRLDPVYGQLLMLSTGTISVLGYEHNYEVIRSWNA